MNIQINAVTDIYIYVCNGTNVVVSESANKTIKDRSVFTFGSSRTQRPYGVMNVVRWSDSSSREICQNSLLTFNLSKTGALDSCASILSTFGRELTSWMMLALRSLRSTDADSYIRLDTATIGVYGLYTHSPSGLARI